MTPYYSHAGSPSTTAIAERFCRGCRSVICCSPIRRMGVGNSFRYGKAHGAWQYAGVE